MSKIGFRVGQTFMADTGFATAPNRLRIRESWSESGIVDTNDYKTLNGISSNM